MFLSKFALKQRVAPTLYQTQRASMVIFKGDRFQKKGKAEEQVYFSQQERNVLKKLLNKMESEAQSQRDQFQASYADEDDHFVPTAEKRKLAKQKEIDERLRKIFSYHGVREDPRLMRALKKWKDTE